MPNEETKPISVPNPFGTLLAQMRDTKYWYHRFIHRPLCLCNFFDSTSSGCSLVMLTGICQEGFSIIPCDVIRLAHGIFELLPIEDAMDWALGLLSSVKPNSNFSKVVGHFMVWRLRDPQNGMIRFVSACSSYWTNIQNVITLYRSEISGEQWSDIGWEEARDLIDKAKKKAEQDLNIGAYYALSVAGAAAVKETCGTVVPMYSVKAFSQIAKFTGKIEDIQRDSESAHEMAFQLSRLIASAPQFGAE